MKTRWDEIRVISVRMSRIYWARSGASMPISFSTATDERHLVGEAGHPVDAVDQRGDLGVGADLGQLLVAAVHVADDRFDRSDPLAVDLGDEPEHAVGRRVLRADVEGHVRGFELDRDRGVGEVHGRPGIERSSCRRLTAIALSPAASPEVAASTFSVDRHVLDVDRPRPRLHLAAKQRERLAQRVALEGSRAGRA